MAMKIAESLSLTLYDWYFQELFLLITTIGVILHYIIIKGNHFLFGLDCRNDVRSIFVTNSPDLPSETFEYI